MKKVRLILEGLQVESFEVERDLPRAGTVRGLESEGASGVHSECWTHCLSDCDPCLSLRPSDCGIDCPSWDGSCEETGTIEA